MILISSFSLFAQNEEQVAPKQMALETAKKQINELKNGILLVRLDYKTKEIAYYEKYNNLTEANKIREKQASVNKEIMNAFQLYYSFSPVYYFSMEDSRKLLDEQYDEIQLLNAFGIVDTLVDLRQQPFFVAEFGFANQGLSTSDTGEQYATKMTINALVIRDHKLVELAEPFPYHVKYNLTSSAKKRYLNPVKKWQVRLDVFLNE
jgi:hypothetical protein